MLKIVRVGALDDNRLDIELNNGNLILLNLKTLLDEPEYAMLLEDDRILYPKTDGNIIYWQNGPSITIAFLMKLIQRS